MPAHRDSTLSISSEPLLSRSSGDLDASEPEFNAWEQELPSHCPVDFEWAFSSILRDFSDTSSLSGEPPFDDLACLRTRDTSSFSGEPQCDDLPCLRTLSSPSRWRDKLMHGLVALKQGDSSEQDGHFVPAGKSSVPSSTIRTSSELPVESGSVEASAEYKGRGLCAAVFTPFSELYCCQLVLAAPEEPTPLSEPEVVSFSLPLSKSKTTQSSSQELGRAPRAPRHDRNFLSSMRPQRSFSSESEGFVEDEDDLDMIFIPFRTVSQQPVLPPRGVSSTATSSQAVFPADRWQDDILASVKDDLDFNFNVQRGMQSRSKQLEGDVPLVLPPLTEILMNQLRHDQDERRCSQQRSAWFPARADVRSPEDPTNPQSV